MPFFVGLDAGRYAQMKPMVHNNMIIGAQLPLKTVNEVYTIAANWIKTQPLHRPGQATMFVIMGIESKQVGKPSHGKAKGGKGNIKYYA
jgi:hypothetical protein